MCDKTSLWIPSIICKSFLKSDEHYRMEKKFPSLANVTIVFQTKAGYRRKKNLKNQVAIFCHG